MQSATQSPIKIHTRVRRNLRFRIDGKPAGDEWADVRGTAPDASPNFFSKADPSYISVRASIYPGFPIWTWTDEGRRPFCVGYPLCHADALNVLTQVERDEGNREAAIVAATKAYTLAWCDGKPFAYHYGLTTAHKHIQELGTRDPQLPDFDKSKIDSIAEMELNPTDKSWIDPATLNIDWVDMRINVDSVNVPFLERENNEGKK
jgi:hypothetical protein